VRSESAARDSADDPAENLSRLTQEVRAAAIPVHPMTLLRWERGAQPTRRHAIAYSRLVAALEEAAAL